MIFKYISIVTGSEQSKAVWKGLNLRLRLQIGSRVLYPWKLQRVDVERCVPNPLSEALHLIWEPRQFFCVKVNYVTVEYFISFLLIRFQVANFRIVCDFRAKFLSK